jgi:hypothetical protein
VNKDAAAFIEISRTSRFAQTLQENRRINKAILRLTLNFFGLSIEKTITGYASPTMTVRRS